MSCENCEESAYVIDKLAKLLAEIAVIVNGAEPHDTSWSYHDLPEKVRALKQAPPAAPDVLPTITPEQARDKQCWKGMDGAIAFHLIERHADNWADIGVMMNAWLEANAQQPAALAAPLFLLHTGTVYGNERGDWEVEANSGKAVDAYCDANPGKTVGLYLAPPAAVPPLMDFLLWADGWRETDEHDELTGADAVAYRVAVTIHREMLAATKGSK